MSTALIRAALEHLSVEDRNFLRGVISKGDPLSEAFLPCFFGTALGSRAYLTIATYVVNVGSVAARWLT
jgi:hypothetical protein